MSFPAPTECVSIVRHPRVLELAPHLPADLLRVALDRSHTRHLAVRDAMEAPAVDCHAADHDVLSDVLSFLDSHGDDHTDGHTDDGMASSPRASDSDSATVISTTMAATASRPGARAKAKTKKRPPRPDRYWAKKHELNKLRSEVEHLNSKLKLLRLCARSPGEIKVTSALSVTIRKTCNRKLASWKRLVNHEREMREQAERTNAKLHALLQYQRQWADGMSGEVAQAVGALRQVRQANLASLTNEVLVVCRCECVLIDLFVNDTTRCRCHHMRANSELLSWSRRRPSARGNQRYTTRCGARCFGSCTSRRTRL